MLAFPHSTLVGEYVHIYSGDPALDLPELPPPPDEGAAYAATKAAIEAKRDAYRVACETNNAALVPLHPGREPTLFHLQHPTGAARAYLDDVLPRMVREKFIHTASLEAVAVCLARVDRGPAPEFQVDRFGVRRLTDKYLAQLAAYDDGGLVLELGGRVFAELFLKKKP